MKKLTKLSQTAIDHNANIYNTYHSKFKMEDGWHPGNKEDNFENMMKLVELTGIPISGTTCLDIGCGSGDLSLFLRKRGAKDYLGIDIYEPSIEKAKKKYPQEKFLLEDFLAAPIRRKFDYAFCSGSLTIKLPTTDNYAFLEAVIAKMWRLTKVGLVFNLLTDDDNEQDPDLFFYSEGRVLDICTKIACNEAEVIFENNKKVFQLHVFMFRDKPQLV